MQRPWRVGFPVCGSLARSLNRAIKEHSCPLTYRLNTPIHFPILSRRQGRMDRGEAAVIQLALIEGVRTVCIDEVVGRRVARLNGLSVTGSIGVLLRARRQGHGVSLRAAIDRMRARGMWLGDDVVRFALREAGEGDSV
jgi:predicted nucleic acid-binding protein